MARKRMFDLEIVDTDLFLEMPVSSQNLYFHLGMRADDDGFISNPKKIIRAIGASEDDLKILIAKNFIIQFENGIVVVRHWKINNYIQKDRYKETIYKEEKALLSIDESNVYNLYTNCTHSIGKVRLDKISIDKSSSSSNIYNINNSIEKNDSCVDGFSQDTKSDGCSDGFQKVIDFYNNNIGLLTPYRIRTTSKLYRQNGQ